MSASPSTRFWSIPLDLIDVDDRFRPFSPAHGEKLAVSFTDYGRTAPIIVRPHQRVPGRFLLVAGLHRLNGAATAGLSEIDAEVRDLDDDGAKRVEIAENVLRYELDAIDHSRSLAELDALWVSERGKNLGGRPRKNLRQNGEGFDRQENSGQNGQGFASRFSAEAQKATRLSERSIRRAVAIGRALSPEMVDLVRRTYLANHQGDLEKLARLAPEKQREALERLGSGECKTLAGAFGRTERSPEDQQVEAFQKVWSRSGAKARRRMLAFVGVSQGEIDRIIGRDVKLVSAAG